MFWCDCGFGICCDYFLSDLFILSGECSSIYTTFGLYVAYVCDGSRKRGVELGSEVGWVEW